MLNSLCGCIRIGIALLCAVVPNAAWPLDDVLNRPAISSKRAKDSLLLAVARDGDRVTAVGERGIALQSEDEGQTWRQTLIPVSVTLTSVHFSDQRNGWITGHSGILLRTTDGGQTWARRFDGVEVAKLVLDAEVAKGGAETSPSYIEAQRLVSDGADKPLLDVRFLSPSLGFVVGAYGIFLRTQDGGATWSPRQASLPNLQGRHLYKIEFVKNDIYVVGEQGAAYLSIDGGESFKELKSPYRGTFFGAIASSDNDLIIYGLRGNAFRVTGRGNEWIKIDTQVPVSFTASKRLASGATVIASQNGALLYSIDGGKTFAPLQVQNRFMISALEETRNGELIIAGRGASRIAMPSNLRGSR